MPKLLVMIPAYNEEASIRQTVADLLRACPEADYVVINDCSQDGTRRILQEEGLNYLDLPLNLGIGGCVQTGFRYAREQGYDVAVQLDGDGQHRAECIHQLIQPILDGEADMVIGSRFISQAGADKGFQSSRMRRMGIGIISQLIRLCTGETVYDTTSGFRAFDGRAIAFFAENYAQDYPEPEAIVTGLMHGLRLREVPALMNERQGGVSSIGRMKSIHYMIKVCLAILLASMRLDGRKEAKRHE